MNVGLRVVGLADPDVVGLRVVGLADPDVVGLGVVGCVEGLRIVGFDVVVGRLIFSQLTSPAVESSNWLFFLKV